MRNDKPNDPLAGLNPADLLKQGAAEDTLIDGKPVGFLIPTIEELAEIFPQFEILELIGKGGMGAVYRVRQRELDRIVALKILPPAIGEEPGFADRFAREAKALAKLNHPGIVTLHEFGQATGLYFILMEYVDGVNLRQLLENGRISPHEALAIVPQICDALQFAHDRGIVHRDIKPENIMLDRFGRVKVADFGLAKLTGLQPDERIRHLSNSDLSLTEAGKIVGTPAYMAPEQLDRPGEVDHRADIYGLGVVFYQILTGELPEKNPSAPSKKIRVDVRLDEIVLRALEKNPEMRFQQVSVMKSKVEELIDQPVPKKTSYKKMMVYSGLMIVLALGWIGFDQLREDQTTSPVQSEKPVEQIPVSVVDQSLAGNAASETWLKLIDAGKYGESWKAAGSVFKKAVSEEQWAKSLDGLRKPFGETVSRKRKSLKEMQSLPGVPDGEYMMIEFETNFSQKKDSIETVVLGKEDDGAWRVIGFFIR